MLSREEKAEIFIETMTPEWREAGQLYRKMRMDKGITLAQMSKLTGFSACKLGSFELGKPVGTRKVLQRVYVLATRRQGAASNDSELATYVMFRDLSTVARDTATRLGDIEMATQAAAMAGMFSEKIFAAGADVEAYRRAVDMVAAAKSMWPDYERSPFANYLRLRGELEQRGTIGPGPDVIGTPAGQA